MSSKDDFEDFFSADHQPGAEVSVPDLAVPPAKDNPEGMLAWVQLVFEDATCLVRGSDGLEVVVRNSVYPSLAPGDPVLLFADGLGRHNLAHPSWWIKGPTVESIIQDDPSTSGPKVVPHVDFQEGKTRPMHFRSKGRIPREVIEKALRTAMPGEVAGWKQPLTRAQFDRLIAVLLPTPSTVGSAKTLSQQGTPVVSPPEAPETPSATYGDEVVFEIQAVEAGMEDRLVGRVLGHAAVLPRRFLRRPANLQLYALDAMIGQRQKAYVLDPTVRPIVVMTGKLGEFWARYSQPHGTSSVSCMDRPGVFLLALHALKRHLCTIRATILEADDQIQIAIYGVVLTVFPEQATWRCGVRAGDVFRAGAIVEVAFSVDLEGGAVHLSLKSTAGTEWHEVLARYPIGATIRGARSLSMTHSGLVVAVPDPEYRLTGLVPYGELTDGNDPYILPSLDEQFQVEVTGHDPLRRQLSLNLSRCRPSPWRDRRANAGDMLPVRIKAYANKQTFAYWEAGQIALINVPQGQLADFMWLQVESFDAENRHIRLGNPCIVRQLRIVAKVEGTTRGRFADGREAELRGGQGLSVGDHVDVILTAIRWGDAGTTLITELAYGAPLEVGSRVEALVVERVKGGLRVRVGSRDAFLPGSQIADRPPRDLDAYLGQVMMVELIKVNHKRKNYVVSRRLILEAEREAKRKDLLGRIREGDVVAGVVKNVVDYGVFVDLGGLDGLLHINEMSYERISHPSDLFRTGQSIQVKILKYDLESQRVSLGWKQLQQDPWSGVENKYPAGTIARGKVVSVPDYGAIVELERGITGMVHLTEMSWNYRSNRASELATVGDEIEFKVLTVDNEKKRLSLSMRALVPDPFAIFASTSGPGARVRGKVTNCLDYGLLVDLGGFVGLLHTSTARPGILFHTTVGDLIEVEVLEVNPETRRVQLGGGWPIPAEDQMPPDSTEARDVLPSTSPEAMFHDAGRDYIPGEVPNPERLSKPEAPTEDRALGSIPQVSGPGPASEPFVAMPAGTGPRVAMHLADERSFNLAPLLRRRTTQLGREIDDDELSVEPHKVSAEAEERLPHLKLDEELEAWFRCSHSDVDFAASLANAGLDALASLVAVVEPAARVHTIPWVALPDWQVIDQLASIAATRLQSIFYPTGDSDDSPDASRPPASAVALNTLLRAVASTPEEVLCYEVLSRELPPRWVGEYSNALEVWFRQWADSPPGTWKVGLTILRVRAAVEEGRVGGAYHLINELLRSGDDECLRAERRQLVERFRKDLKQQPVFFKRYQRDFGEQVRVGGFSFVIPVVESTTGERLALKHYVLKNLPAEEMALVMELFEHENGLLARVGRHPNLVRFYERLGPGCNLLEWIAGESLDPGRHGLGDADGWWTPRRVVEFALGVASVLRYVNEALGGGFVHNDMAPRNIMITPTDEPGTDWVKLIDLGLSTTPKFYSVSTAIDDLGVRVNEVYRAPEVRAGQGYSPRSDMYSLGVILFELICRALPSAVGQAQDVQTETTTMMALSQRLLSLGAGARRVELLIRQMLAVAPAHRPDSWAAIEAGFKEVHRG